MDDDPLTFKPPKTPDEKMEWDIIKFVQSHQDSPLCSGVPFKSITELGNWLVKQGWKK